MAFPYLNPPNFDLILGDDPTTPKPTEDQRNEALEQSRKYWYKAAAIARHNRTVGLPPEATNPRFMLQHVPKPYVNPQETTSVKLGASLLSLAVEGRAHWKTEGSKDCGIADDMEKQGFFQLGSRNQLVSISRIGVFSTGKVARVRRYRAITIL